MYACAGRMVAMTRAPIRARDSLVRRVNNRILRFPSYRVSSYFRDAGRCNGGPIWRGRTPILPDGCTNINGVLAKKFTPLNYLRSSAFRARSRLAPGPRHEAGGYRPSVET